MCVIDGVIVVLVVFIVALVVVVVVVVAVAAVVVANIIIVAVQSNLCAKMCDEERAREMTKQRDACTGIVIYTVARYGCVL